MTEKPSLKLVDVKPAFVELSDLAEALAKPTLHELACTDLSELLGKTVAETYEEESSFTLRFTDGTYAYIRPCDYEDRDEKLELDWLCEEYFTDFTKAYEVGLVSCEEYEERKASLNNTWAEQEEAREKAQLARLLAKYPNGV